MKTRTLDAELFGRRASFEYSETWVGYSILFLRVVMGWSLFYAGITKVIAGNWSARGFLLNAIPEGNPFASLWPVFAEMPLIDILVMWGLTLTGLGLMLGALVRWNAFWAAIMMLFFWAASLPLEHAIIFDDHMVYAFLLFGLGAFGSGRLFGLDSRIERLSFVENNPWLKLFLG